MASVRSKKFENCAITKALVVIFPKEITLLPIKELVRRFHMNPFFIELDLEV